MFEGFTLKIEIFFSILCTEKLNLNEERKFPQDTQLIISQEFESWSVQLQISWF